MVPQPIKVIFIISFISASRDDYTINTYSDGYWDTISLPCLPAGSQISKEKEVTDIIADN